MNCDREFVRFEMSNSEIKRRKLAFFMLATSFLLGMLLWDKVLIVGIGYGAFAWIVLLLLSSTIITFNFLTSYKSLYYEIENSKIVRTIKHRSEEIEFNNIKSIHIKKTFFNHVRELIIKGNCKRIFRVNGLWEMDLLKDIIFNVVPEDVKIREKKERLDFDNVLFYPLLGFILSSLCVFFLCLLVNSSPSVTLVIKSILSVVSFIFGCYWIIHKPVKSIHVARHSVSDYCWGTFFIVIALLLQTSISV